MNSHWENNYVESMEQMKFTGKQQERMVDFMVNHTSEKGNCVSAARTWRSFGIKHIAIAAFCLCMITAGAAVAHAAGVFQPVSEAFREIFHLGTDTAQISDDVGSSPGIADTSNHVTITADAVLGDDYNFTVLFSIKKRDGTAFKQDDIQALTDDQNSISFRREEIRTDKELGNQKGYFHFYGANTDNTSFQLLYICATDTEDSIGAQATASFTDFGYYDSSMNFVPVVSGNWNITFPLDYEDSTRHFAVKQRIEQDGETITVKKADISSVGFHIEFEIGDGEIKDEMVDIIENIPLELVLTDGQKIDLKEKSKGLSVWTENNSTNAAFGNIFYQIIPIEQMESLRIGSLTLDF